MGFFIFKGGVHVEGKKELSANKAIEKFPVPEKVYLPLQQHLGLLLEPIVNVGDKVKIGQKIADNQAFLSAPIHASVSGTVTAIEDLLYSQNGLIKTIIITNDKKEEWEEGVKYEEYIKLNSDELLKIVREKGIVGLGGAAFPTHVKYAQKNENIDTLIINGAECEPYLSADNRIMIECSSEVLEGIKIVMHILGVKRAVIGIENNKKRAIEEMRRVIIGHDEIEITELVAKYPQGGEKQLIKALLNRSVPPRKLPSEVGVVVSNIGTVKAVYDAVVLGKALIERVITVSGGGVSDSKNLLVRIGTQVKEVLNLVGNDREKTLKFIMGGPMMGHAQFSEDVPIIKGTSGVTALTKEEMKPYKAKSCISCGKCLDVCPMNLVPLMYPRLAEQMEWIMMEARYKLMDCIECGACSYICPANRPIVEAIKVGKAKLRGK